MPRDAGLFLGALLLACIVVAVALVLSALA